MHLDEPHKITIDMRITFVKVNRQGIIKERVLGHGEDAVGEFIVKGSIE